MVGKKDQANAARIIFSWIHLTARNRPTTTKRRLMINTAMPMNDRGRPAMARITGMTMCSPRFNLLALTRISEKTGKTGQDDDQVAGSFC